MAQTTTVLITGNTYPVKDSLKAMGGRWDAVERGWRVPAARAAEAQALVSGGSRPRQSAPRAPSAPRQPRTVGETGTHLMTSRFEGSRHDRDSDRRLGEVCWLRSGGTRICVVVVGFERASWIPGDVREDMGDYSGHGRGAWLGTTYYRRATDAETLGAPTSTTNAQAAAEQSAAIGAAAGRIMAERLAAA